MSFILYYIKSTSSAGASVSLQWSPPTDNCGRDDLTYTVSISPLTQLSAIVGTTASVTVDYNREYIVSVNISNCAGTSDASQLTFTVGRLETVVK